MKSSKCIIAICLLLIILAGCRKKDVTPTDCIPPTIMELHVTGGLKGFSNHYAITISHLFKDTSAFHNNKNCKFNFMMPDSLFTKVRTLPYEIPQRLYSENDSLYGNSMIADGIIMTIVLYKNNTVYKWTLLSGPPSDLQPFYEKLITAVIALEQQ